jgi:hypothetical protein
VPNCILAWAGLLFAAMSTVLVQQPLPSEPSLITRSRLIVSTAGWTAPYYVWLSRNKALAFESAASVFGYPRVVHAVIEIDAARKRARPFAVFNKRWTDPEYTLGLFSASPDGRWIVFHTYHQTYVGSGAWVLARVDGRSWQTAADDKVLFYQFYQPSIGSPIWTSDNRHWVLLKAVDGHMECLVFSVTSPDTPRRVALPTWSAPLFPTTVNPLVYMELMGVRSDGRLLARVMTFPYEGPRPMNTPIEVMDFGLEPTAAPPHHFTITPPPCQREDEVALSPDGRKLAWLVYRRDLTQGGPPSTMKEADTFIGAEEMWVSQADGTGMKRLGWLPTRPYHEDPDDRFQSGDVKVLRWTPNSKHLSFIYRQALYTVRAD